MGRGTPRRVTGAIAASLRGSDWEGEAERIAAFLANEGVDETRLEASVRGDAGGAARGGRMMVERVRPGLAGALVELLGPCLEEDDDALLSWASARGQPTIVGWDVGRDPPVMKLYVNASDASEALRRELGAVLGLDRAPHVVGVNLGDEPEDRELKIYEQHADAPEGVPEALARWAVAAPVAGWVVSLDAPALRPRAYFAALRPTEGAPELERLPGWSEGHAAALPFPIGFAKSVGFDPTGEHWVAYVKPAGAQPAGHDLEPAICLRSPSAEIGIFVEPAGGRAYARVGDRALSYRVREGAPEPAAIEAAMGWAVATLERAEGGAPEWSAPPEPWEVTDG
jgi:hypothetical protein